MIQLFEDAKKIENKERPLFAEVVEVTSAGVKIKVADEILPKHYKSLAVVGVGDTVYINYVSGTILIIGKLLY